ncbi:hypothetical protein CS535_19010, partial [Yersinia massiliensis]
GFGIPTSNHATQPFFYCRQVAYAPNVFDEPLIARPDTKFPCHFVSQLLVELLYVPVVPAVFAVSELDEMDATGPPIRRPAQQIVEMS